jgi:hypothetical protein
MVKIRRGDNVLIDDDMDVCFSPLHFKQEMSGVVILNISCNESGKCDMGDVFETIAGMLSLKKLTLGNGVRGEIGIIATEGGATGVEEISLVRSSIVMESSGFAQLVSLKGLRILDLSRCSKMDLVIDEKVHFSDSLTELRMASASMVIWDMGRCRWPINLLKLDLSSIHIRGSISRRFPDRLNHHTKN